MAFKFRTHASVNKSKYGTMYEMNVKMVDNSTHKHMVSHIFYRLLYYPSFFTLISPSVSLSLVYMLNRFFLFVCEKTFFYFEEVAFLLHAKLNVCNPYISIYVYKRIGHIESEFHPIYGKVKNDLCFSLFV